MVRVAMNLMLSKKMDNVAVSTVRHQQLNAGDFFLETLFVLTRNCQSNDNYIQNALTGKIKRLVRLKKVNIKNREIKYLNDLKPAANKNIQTEKLEWDAVKPTIVSY